MDKEILNGSDDKLLDEEFIFPEKELKKQNGKSGKKKLNWKSFFQKKAKEDADAGSAESAEMEEKDLESINLTLEDAYGLLGLKVFPVSYEDVRMAYYLQELTIKDKPVQIELIKRARKLIFDNISVNPFEEGKQLTEKGFEDTVILNHEPENNEVKEPKKALQLKGFFTCRKKKKDSGLKWGDVEKELKLDSTPKKEEKKKSKLLKRIKSPNILKFGAFLTVIILLVYLVYRTEELPGSTEEYTSVETTAEDEKLEDTSGGQNISLEQSIILLERDGLKIDKKRVSFVKEELTDYSSVEIVHIPFSNITLLKREFTANKPYITYRVSDYSLYKFKGSNEPETAWEHKGNYADYDILDYDMNGLWEGTCTTGNGKYELTNVKMSIDATENGYMVAEFSFLSELKLPGKIVMEGTFDKNKNRFVLQEKEWKQRPKLFVAPELIGRMDLEEPKLTETLKTTKTVFDLKAADIKQSNENITNEVVKSLLEGESASHKDTTVLLDQITSCSITAVKGKENDITEVAIVANAPKNIAEYTVKGTIDLKKRNGIWIITESALEVVSCKVDISGTYKGTEVIDKKTYQTTYEIIPSSKRTGEYTATVRKNLYLLPFVAVHEETRNIKVENDTITSERVDVLKGDIAGDASITLNLNYKMDKLEGNGISLNKKD